MSSITRIDVVISTDGACKGNPGPGGYACVLRYKDRKHEISGYEPATTNNRMELRAVIEAVRKLKKPCNVLIRTDSHYVCTGLANAREWCRNGWRTKSGAKAKNDDLWQELTEVGTKGHHKFSFQYVPGHSGDEDNERCDALAKEQIRLHAEG